jgi:hypothetical protein
VPPLDPAEAGLRHVCANLPDHPLTAAPLTVYAALAWSGGDGTLTRAALERALRCDPQYRLAHLLGGLVDHGLRITRATTEGWLAAAEAAGLPDSSRTGTPSMPTVRAVDAATTAWVTAQMEQVTIGQACADRFVDRMDTMRCIAEKATLKRAEWEGTATELNAARLRLQAEIEADR